MRSRAWQWQSAWVAVLSAGCATRPSYRGPLPERNQHPAQQLVVHLSPAPVASLPAGESVARLQASYSSLWLTGSSPLGSIPSRSYRMDGEYLRTEAMLRIGLGRNVELAAAVPFAHTTGGFLDGFIIGYHDLLGFPDQHRDQEPRDRFEVGATRGGTTVWGIERSGFELLDVPVDLKWTVIQPQAGQPGIALRCGVELPLGDDERGYGSGGLDSTLGVLVGYRLGDVDLTGHAQHAFASTPDQARHAGFSFADVTSLGLAAEVPVLDGLTGLCQIEWETSTLRRLDLPAVSRNQLLLWIGGRVDVAADWAIEVALGEDLASLVSPDFTATLAMVWL